VVVSHNPHHVVLVDHLFMAVMAVSEISVAQHHSEYLQVVVSMGINLFQLRDRTSWNGAPKSYP
jgi:hypothetical protein